MKGLVVIIFVILFGMVLGGNRKCDNKKLTHRSKDRDWFVITPEPVPISSRKNVWNVEAILQGAKIRKGPKKNLSVYKFTEDQVFTISAADGSNFKPKNFGMMVTNAQSVEFAIVQKGKHIPLGVDDLDVYSLPSNLKKYVLKLNVGKVSSVKVTVRAKPPQNDGEKEVQPQFSVQQLKMKVCASVKTRGSD